MGFRGADAAIRIHHRYRFKETKVPCHFITCGLGRGHGWPQPGCGGEFDQIGSMRTAAV